MRVTDKYIFFWRSISIYSNWFECLFEIDDRSFNCSEQYFMYQKALTFGDTETAEIILNTQNPRAQKQAGRNIKGYNELVWNQKRYDIMLQGVYEKFNQNEDLKYQMLQTGNKIFVEASPYDCVWGVGLSEDDDLILDEKNWRGENLLGKVLCEVRKRLGGK